MSSQPAVTVVVPCYRCQAYLREAIDSALAQDYAALQIVVVDDGSPDDVAGALAPYGDRVRLIRHDRNRGTAAARNTAIEASDAPFIAFLDADDRWLKTKISKQVDFMMRNPICGLVYAERFVIDASGRRLHVFEWPGPAPAGNCWEALLRKCEILPSQVLIRRSALGQERFDPDTRGAEDWDLWWRLSVRVRFGYVPEPLVEWRRHEGNFSRQQEVVCAGKLVMLQRMVDRLPAGSRRAAVEMRLRAHQARWGTPAGA